MTQPVPAVTNPEPVPWRPSALPAMLAECTCWDRRLRAVCPIHARPDDAGHE